MFKVTLPGITTSEIVTWETLTDALTFAHYAHGYGRHAVATDEDDNILISL